MKKASLPAKFHLYKRLYNYGSALLGLVDIYALLNIEMRFSVWWVILIASAYLGCLLFELWSKYLEKLNE